MRPFDHYKRFRNKVTELGYLDSFEVIWAYSQFLQIREFPFPASIERDPTFARDGRSQPFTWQLELMVRELIMHAGFTSRRGRSLRRWNTLRRVINLLRAATESMSNAHVGPHNITLELVRIAHQQFPWQVLPNTRIASRYFRVFGDPEVNAICEDVTGLSVAKIYLIGMCFWGLFHKKPFSARTITSTIPNISNDDVKKFSMRYALDLDSLRALLKAEHSFDAAFAYRHSSLRAYPLIGLAGVGDVGLVCPLPTLLFRRFTSGLYYDLVNHANFGNAFGPAFQRYVGDVLTRASAGTGIRVIPEEKYGPKAHRKDTVDWIAAQGSDAAVFLECKTKRLSIGAKSSIAVQADLNADISTLADGVVQMYKTIRAYRDGHYRCLPFDQRRRVFPVVVTLENWFAFGPPIGSELERQVREKFASISLPATLLAEMPYTILGCDELEVAAQIWSRVGLTAFFEPKLTDARYRGWILDGYMRHQFGAELDAAHPLFEDAFDDMYRRIGIAV